MPLSRLEQEGVFPALLESTSPLREAYVRGAELPPSFSALQPLLNIGDLVYSSNACNVPECKILYDSFIPAMWQAVASGHVSFEHASFVADGLRWGFKAGIDTSQLISNGHRWFKNYNSPLDSKHAVSKSVAARLSEQKTLDGQ